MSSAVVVLLVVMWALILAPGAVRGRHERSPVTSVNSFERSMSILASDLRARTQVPGRRNPPGRRVLVVADPRAFGGGSSRRRTLHRRRLVLQGLGGAVVLAAIGALVLGGPFTPLLGALVVVLVAYVAGLVKLRADAERARRTVRRLPPRTSADHLSAHHGDRTHLEVPLAAGHG
jgi:hypothetical protein